MKALQITLFSLLFSSLSLFAQAQNKTEKIKVAGECGMCKKKIEKAAREAGASVASWNTESKVLTVTYNATSTNNAKIQQAVAGTGYDTPKYKASEESYNSLHECCKYERAGGEAKACCENGKCSEEKCMKDGKCAKDMSCCKDSDCSSKDCCKKA